jgi:hypothetical protein
MVALVVPVGTARSLQVAAEAVLFICNAWDALLHLRRARCPCVGTCHALMFPMAILARAISLRFKRELFLVSCINQSVILELTSLQQAIHL